MEKRVSLLEAESMKLDASKVFCNDELSALLNNMTHIVQTLAVSDEYDRNTAKRLDDALNDLETLKVELRHTILSLWDVQSKIEQLNAT
jgi:hypothetical protein